MGHYKLYMIWMRDALMNQLGRGLISRRLPHTRKSYTRRRSPHTRKSCTRRRSPHTWKIYTRRRSPHTWKSYTRCRSPHTRERYFRHLVYYVHILLYIPANIVSVMVAGCNNHLWRNTRPGFRFRFGLLSCAYLGRESNQGSWYATADELTLLWSIENWK